MSQRDPRLWLLCTCRASLAPFAGATSPAALPVLLPLYLLRRFRLSPLLATAWGAACPAGALLGKLTHNSRCSCGIWDLIW